MEVTGRHAFWIVDDGRASRGRFSYGGTTIGEQYIDLLNQVNLGPNGFSDFSRGGSLQRYVDVLMDAQNGIGPGATVPHIVVAAKENVLPSNPQVLGTSDGQRTETEPQHAAQQNTSSQESVMDYEALEHPSAPVAESLSSGHDRPHLMKNLKKDELRSECSKRVCEIFTRAERRLKIQLPPGDWIDYLQKKGLQADIPTHLGWTLGTIAKAVKKPTVNQALQIIRCIDDGTFRIYRAESGMARGLVNTHEETTSVAINS